MPLASQEREGWVGCERKGRQVGEGGTGGVGGMGGVALANCTDASQMGQRGGGGGEEWPRSTGPLGGSERGWAYPTSCQGRRMELLPQQVHPER